MHDDSEGQRPSTRHEAEVAEEIPVEDDAAGADSRPTPAEDLAADMDQESDDDEGVLPGLGRLRPDDIGRR